jgi:prepilin-type processing-associated H-X9-DG protein
MSGQARKAVSLIELLIVLAIVTLLLGLLLPALQKARGAAHRSRCAGNLKQLGIAHQQYHDQFGYLPAGLSVFYASDPWVKVGWHARILPFLEQESLFIRMQAALKEDIPFFANQDNLQILRTVLPFYACPADPRSLSAHDVYGNGLLESFPSYLGVEGTDQFARDGVLFSNSRIRWAEVTDGLSATLLVGERPLSASATCGPWYLGDGQDGTGSCAVVLGSNEWNTSSAVSPTSTFAVSCPRGPFSFRPGDASNPCDLLHFWSQHSGGAHFLFCDGSVRFLNYSAASILANLATRAAGDLVEN